MINHYIFCQAFGHFRQQLTTETTNTTKGPASFAREQPPSKDKNQRQ